MTRIVHVLVVPVCRRQAGCLHPNRLSRTNGANARKLYGLARENNQAFNYVPTDLHSSNVRKGVKLFPFFLLDFVMQ